MKNAASNKRERSLGELVLVVLVFALLMAIFIHYFFKSEAQINRVGFASLASSFVSKVILIHGQWLTDGRPKQVNIVEYEQVNGDRVHRQVTVNNAGWVDSNLKNLACQQIWQFVMAMPMTFVRQPISAIRLQRQSAASEQVKASDRATICRFSIKSGEFFEYSAKNGKVNSAK